MDANSPFEAIRTRAAALGIQAGSVIYMLTWNDVLNAVADHLGSQGVRIDDLTNEELLGILADVHSGLVNIPVAGAVYGSIALPPRLQPEVAEDAHLEAAYEGRFEIMDWDGW